MRQAVPSIIALSALSMLSGCKVREFGAPPSSGIRVNKGLLVSQSDPVARSTVALFSEKSGAQFCTGTLIDRRLVLSAGHCFVSLQEDRTKEKYYVAFGPDIPEQGTSLVKANNAVGVEKILVHPLYSPTGNVMQSLPTDETGIRWREGGVDAALVYLSEDAPTGFEPVKHPDDAELTLEKEQKVIVAGYGRNLSVDDGKGKPSLHKGHMAIEALSVGEDDREILAAPIDGMDACYGDSGGPLYVEIGAGKPDERLAVIGIVSAARDRFRSAACTKGTLFTDARYLRSWILDNMPKR